MSHNCRHYWSRGYIVNNIFYYFRYWPPEIDPVKWGCLLTALPPTSIKIPPITIYCPLSNNPVVVLTNSLCVEYRPDYSITIVQKHLNLIFYTDSHAYRGMRLGWIRSKLDPEVSVNSGELPALTSRHRRIKKLCLPVNLLEVTFNQSIPRIRHFALGNFY